MTSYTLDKSNYMPATKYLLFKLRYEQEQAETICRNLNRSLRIK